MRCSSRRRLLLAVSSVGFALWSPEVSVAQEHKLEEEFRSPWSVFPVLGFAPTTSAIFGAGLVYTFTQPGADAVDEEEPRRSSLAAVGFYSLQNQFVVSLAPNVYWQGEAWQASGALDALHFPNRFYGIGADTSEDDVERYTERVFSASGTLTRRLVGSLRFGGQIQSTHSTMVEVEEGGSFSRDRVTGSDGGLLIGVGPVLAWDDRDNDFDSRSGGLYRLAVSFFPELLGDFDFRAYDVDLRHFVPLWGEHNLGLQMSARFTDGDAPFQALALLGGSDQMRGYAKGRFRDKHAVTGQVEYRLPLWWRFGAVGFVGVGNTAAALDSFALSDAKFAGGGGLRYALNPDDRVNLRFDAAGTSTGEFSAYITLGEAF